MYSRTEIISGNREVEFWPMEPDDAPHLLSFYRSLPAEDLRYLRVDVTRSEVMDRWVEGIDSGQMFHLLVGYRGRIIADGELDYPEYGWSQHVGELRLVIDRAFRGSGLSQMLVEELLSIAAEESLLKVMVQMTVDQHAAITLFSRLGFEREAVLKNHVQDQDGELRDLLMMAYFFQS